jgi:hypothetical protein
MFKKSDIDASYAKRLKERRRKRVQSTNVDNFIALMKSTISLINSFTPFFSSLIFASYGRIAETNTGS